VKRIAVCVSVSIRQAAVTLRWFFEWMWVFDNNFDMQQKFDYVSIQVIGDFF